MSPTRPHRAEMPGAVHGILSARGLRDISNQFAAVEMPSNGLNIRKLAAADSIDPRLQVAFPGPSGYEISGWWYPVRTPPKTFQNNDVAILSSIHGVYPTNYGDPT